MSIVQADIKFLKSSNTDSAGGIISATEITDLALNNLFDSVSVGEGESGLVDYRKLFVKNTHVSISWQNVAAWILAQTASEDDEIALGIGTNVDDDGSSTLTPLSASSVIALVASFADYRSVTIVGEDADHALVSETIALNGTAEVVGAQVFSKIYYVSVSLLSGSGFITIKQGSGGVTVGTIGISKYSAILYLAALTKEEGFKIGNIPAGSAFALWLRRTVVAGAGAYSANNGVIKVQGETT